MNARTAAEAAVLRLREGDLRAAAALGIDAIAVAPADPYAAGAALLVAAVSGDAALVRDVDAAAVWEATLTAGDADATAFFGGAYASTIGDAFGAREILAAVFRRTPSAAASIEALLAAAGSGDRALQAAVAARIESIAGDAPPDLRAAAEHAAATIARASGNHEEARRLATRAQRSYERAGWAYYAAKAAELAGDVRAAERAYRRFGAARDTQRLAAGEHIAHDALAALTAREREVAALVAAGLANKEIAAALGISVKTVEKNVTAIYAKLGIVRRVQLARLFAPKRERDTQRGNIGAARTPFFGRRAELAELRERALRHRLLSLVGPGGSGKTRLATELAERLADLHSGGVWFIDLAGVAAPAAVWPFVAATLGVSRDPQRSLDAAVCTWLAARAPLLVLDNAEHLLPDIARVVNALLEAGPGVRIIVTSRDRVGVFGENVFRVGAMHAADGIGFFREKAAAAGAHVDDDRLAAAICERLDCIPLAIELAAARLYALSLPELAAAIERHVPVLATADVGIPARHHSIDALVAWGYAPLPAPAQRAFRQAAVFAGTFPLAAAQAVLGGGARSDLALLARAALVEALPSGGYRMLQVVRDVALANLREHGEEAGAMRAFAAYYEALLHGAEETWFATPIATWLEPLKTDSHNILHALHWALGEQHDLDAGVRMAADGARIWAEMAREPEFEPYLTRALELGATASPRVRVRLRLARARALDILRAGAQALEMSRLAFDDAREGGNAVDIAMCRLALGSTSATMRDVGTAREHLNAALEIFRAEGLRRPAASALTALAIIAETSEQRAADFRNVLEIARELGDQLLEAITLSNLSIAYTELGENETARGCVLAAAAMFERLGAPMRLARARIDLARAEFVCGNLAGAASAAADALRYFAALGAPLLRAECALWIAKALAPDAPAPAAQFYGYAEAMRRAGGETLADPLGATLTTVLGAERFAELAAAGAAHEPSTLLDLMTPVVV